MITKNTNTYWARIYIAGNTQLIEQICKEHTFVVGLCVNVQPTEYIYSGGQESGAMIELINYPRFPVLPAELDEQAIELGNKLMEGLHETSFTVMTTTTTIWISRRDENQHIK